MFCWAWLWFWGRYFVWVGYFYSWGSGVHIYGSRGGGFGLLERGFWCLSIKIFVGGVVLDRYMMEVDRPAREAGEVYDFYSRFYRLVEWFEREVSRRAVEVAGRLELASGGGLVDVWVLDVGCGVGGDVGRLKEEVGGFVVGLDLSSRMVRRAGSRVDGQVGFVVGDALELPFRSNSFDIVFMKSVLELFSIDNIKRVLDEVGRVLRASGFLVAASLNREGYEGSLFVRLYEWLFTRMDRYLDCRPIYLERLLGENGFSVYSSSEVLVGGVAPFRVVVGRPE